MPIVQRPSTGASLLGGSIVLPANECRHALPPRHVSPWAGETGTAGTVAVVGAGKMGLPLAAQFAGHGWDVMAVDVQEAVVAAIQGRSHLGEGRGGRARRLGPGARATSGRPTGPWRRAGLISSS
jgi:hypothetical protein